MLNSIYRERLTKKIKVEVNSREAKSTYSPNLTSSSQIIKKLIIRAYQFS